MQIKFDEAGAVKRFLSDGEEREKPPLGRRNGRGRGVAWRCGDDKLIIGVRSGFLNEEVCSW